MSLHEALTCVTLALRDGVRPPISLISVIIWISAALGWGVAFYFGHPALEAAIPSRDLAPILSAILKYLALIVLYLVAVVITVRLAIELMLMKRIQKACLVHYPELSTSHKNSLFGSLKDMIKTSAAFAIGGLICLLIPAIGPVLLFVLFGYLNVRSLINDALDGIASDSEKKEVITTSRLTMTLVGAMVSALLLIPIVGFFAPSILGASACHLGMRKTLKLRKAANP